MEPAKRIRLLKKHLQKGSKNILTKAELSRHSTIWVIMMFKTKARPAGSPDRKAMAIAGNDPESMSQTAKIVDDFGFDPVVIGRPANGLMLEPGGELFGASETKANSKSFN